MIDLEETRRETERAQARIAKANRAAKEKAYLKEEKTFQEYWAKSGAIHREKIEKMIDAEAKSGQYSCIYTLGDQPSFPLNVRLLDKIGDELRSKGFNHRISSEDDHYEGSMDPSFVPGHVTIKINW